MMVDLAAERKRLEEMRNSLQKEKSSAEQLTGQLEDEIKRIKAREKVMLREIQDNLNSEVAGLYRSIREAEHELKKQRSRERIEQAKKQLEIIGSEADRAKQGAGRKVVGAQ